MNNSSIAINAMPYDNSPVIKTHVEPDAIAYTSYFYAKNHIPAIQERPGNNTINKEVFHKYNIDYNLFCYK
jgi:hypothetical protein